MFYNLGDFREFRNLKMLISDKDKSHGIHLTYY